MNNLAPIWKLGHDGRRMAQGGSFGASSRNGFRVTLLFACWVLLGCQRSYQAPECLPCSRGAAVDTKAQAEVAALWQSVAHDVWKEDALDLSCMCFGSGPSASVEGRNIELTANWERREQAARAAHLALHRRRPAWDARSHDACETRVARALEFEAEAHELELATRQSLGVTTPRYPFEPEYWATPAPQRRAWLLNYFRSHPQGEGAVPGFASQYRARCGAPPG